LLPHDIQKGQAGTRGHTSASGPDWTQLKFKFQTMQLRTNSFCAHSGARAGRSRFYLTSTLAPASSNFFLMAAASSLFTPSLIGLGAPSTRSLASFKPRLVTSRTALMTLILLAPTSVSTTENSVFSSAGAAPAAAPPAIMTGAAAAADTPKVSSIFLTRSAASSRVRPLISSRITSPLFAIAVSSPLRCKLDSLLSRFDRCWCGARSELVGLHRFVDRDGQVAVDR